MRRMSFAITKRQFLDGTKTQTRRLGWASLREGELIMGVNKCMGLRKGERQIEFGVRRVARKWTERLDTITQADVVAEGFPELTPTQFIELFCKVNKCEPSTLVTCIEFTPTNEEAQP
jgi:hypothetical protein